MTFLRSWAAVSAAVLACAAGASAQSAPSGPAPDALSAAQVTAIDTIAATAIDRKATPSVTIGVAKNGRLVFAKGYGFRNLDDKIAADADTVYGIGSNTKQFTAAAILMLRDEGKLDVDAPVGRYLPGIAHGDEVLIRNLLTHTGGYAEFTETDEFDRLGARPATNDEILDTVVSRPLGFKPGTRWQYSNTAFVMLARVVERLSGKSYSEFLRTRIFDPLGMTRTRFEDQQLVESDRAIGYSRFAMGDQEHEQHLDYTWFSGAGAIESTVGDLEKWNTAIDRGTLLTPASRTMMHTTFKLADGSDTRYGFGLFVQTLPSGKHIVLHGGDTTGFGSQDARFVEDGIDIIVLTNQEPAAYNAIMNAVYRAVAPSPAPLPASTLAPSGPAPAAAAAVPVPTPAASPPANPYLKPELDALARRWLDDAVAGTIDLAKLRPSARAMLRQPRYQAALRDLARFGARKYRLLNIDRRQPTSSYQYLVETPKRTLFYLFSIDDDGSIAGADVFDPNPLAPDPPPAAAQ